jgi:hypothetical protein
MNNLKFLILFLSVVHLNVTILCIDSNKIWTFTCRVDNCKEGLETCISSNCFGARGCKSIIDEFYPTCSRCVNNILDPDGYELVNGNYHSICDNNDDLQVKVCLFYCRVNYYPFGQCVRQNNVPICKCGSDAEITTVITTTSSTITSTISTTKNEPLWTLLLTLVSHNSCVLALTQLQNGYGYKIRYGEVGYSIN